MIRKGTASAVPMSTPFEVSATVIASRSRLRTRFTIVAQG
jgi:hypothetical protein